MKLGIIGGTGLEKLGILENPEEKIIETPYGNPSSIILTGKIKGIDVCLLSRHGKNHEYPPTQVNNKANIYALKELGCSHILATTAAGSLKEEIKRGDFVILSQFIDFTRHRKITFHEHFVSGVKHVSLADPFSEYLRKKLIEATKQENISMHEKGTVITIEGPRFSTRAESKMFRQWGGDVINMSTAPEAILAREAELEYSCIAMSTDYDCWKTDEEPVSFDAVRKVADENAEKVTRVLLRVIDLISSEEEFREEKEIIKNKIRTIPDFPKPGIMFRDITTLLGDFEGIELVLKILEKRYKNKEIDVIAGIESRGFLIAGMLSSRINKPVALLRKPGKLPGETEKQEYELEYGKDSIEIHKDAIKPGQKVLLIDDLIATGGTAQAGVNLIKKLGGKIIEACFIIDLPELKGKEKLNCPIYTIVEFEGK